MQLSRRPLPGNALVARQPSSHAKTMMGQTNLSRSPSFAPPPLLLPPERTGPVQAIGPAARPLIMSASRSLAPNALISSSRDRPASGCEHPTDLEEAAGSAVAPTASIGSCYRWTPSLPTRIVRRAHQHRPARATDCRCLRERSCGGDDSATLNRGRGRSRASRSAEDDDAAACTVSSATDNRPRRCCQRLPPPPPHKWYIAVNFLEGFARRGVVFVSPRADGRRRQAK